MLTDTDELQVARCVQEGFQMMRSDNSTTYAIHVWPQTWPDTGCGFGGYAGQAITQSTTVIFETQRQVAVFHNGRLAYVLDLEREPDKSLAAEWLLAKEFPGKHEYLSKYHKSVYGNR